MKESDAEAKPGAKVKRLAEDNAEVEAKYDDRNKVWAESYRAKREQCGSRSSYAVPKQRMAEALRPTCVLWTDKGRVI